MVVKLTPKWKDTSKPGNDSSGWKRGARGIDGLYDKDGRDYMKSANPKADKMMFGGAPNGTPADPSQLTDKGKGAKGYDAYDGDYYYNDRWRHDDGVSGR